ncbi:MAG: FAD-dependent oxidoreductase [Planctomycetota bacterium]
MADIEKKKFVIIGAGPTGLGAALHLRELGEDDFLILEAEDHAGGLASSVVDEQGFTWDLGGHVQFSHYRKFDEYMDLALAEAEWNVHQRESWVWLFKRFVPYPLQYNLHRLPREVMWQCVKGLLDVARSGTTRPADFRDWILKTFGNGIAETFLMPYNFKVWAHPPEMMNSQWVGERVAVPNLETVLKGICLEQDNVSWGPNNAFRFPRRGGTGAIWRRLADTIPVTHMRYSESVTRVDSAARMLTTDQGRAIGYRHLISTMPIDHLTRLMGEASPAARAQRLLYSNVHVVGIGLRGQPPEHLKTKCWMYFPESDCPFYRVTVFSNYSALNTPMPGETWSLMAEVSESAHKPVDHGRVVEEVVRGMRATELIRPNDEILSRWHRRLDHGYPTPSLERETILRELLPALESKEIYSRGRFGAWCYEVSNQDHSFMQGVEVIERILHGHEELTLSEPGRVNSRVNPFPYEEWHEIPLRK